MILVRQVLHAAWDRLRARSLLITPEEKPIEGASQRDQKPMALPGIVCTAELSCDDPARNAAADGSRLTVVWFQDENAFPVAPTVLTEIAATD